MRKLGSTIALIFIMLWTYGQDYNQKIEDYRTEFKDELISGERAPLEREDLQHIHFYEPDSNYRVIAQLTFIHDEQPFIIPTSSGKEKRYTRYALVDFELSGKKLRLTLYKSVLTANIATYTDYLFLPFTDATNDDETYGGGRYLDVKRSEINGNKLQIDFNLAYNPYCAYSSGYNCPIPPQENALYIPIEAGEKKFTGLYKKK